MKSHLSKLKFCLLSALKVSFKSAVWLLKIMIPATLLVAVLDYIGVISYASAFVEPFFAPAGLDGRGVFVFITAIFASIYPAIAVMATLGIEFRMAVILASMLLIAHNLIVESTIQKRTGSSFLGMIALRIIFAYITAVVLNAILPTDMSGTLILDVAVERPDSWGALFAGWGVSMVKLTGQILLFVISLNFLQNILREYKILDALIKPLSPVMKVLGLSNNTTFLWLVANTLGLAYGGTIIVKEVEKGEMTRNEARKLNISIALTHSIIEDTILFIAIGIPFLWLILPRLLCSIIAVHGDRLIRYLFVKRKRLAV